MYEAIGTSFVASFMSVGIYIQINSEIDGDGTLPIAVNIECALLEFEKKTFLKSLFNVWR